MCSVVRLRPLLPLVCLLGLALAACGDLRTGVYEPTLARRDQRAMRIKIVSVHDNLGRDWCADSRVSHVVEVDVLDGPADLAGKPLTLPYDAFSQGRQPPEIGTEMVVAPADWLKQPATQKFRMRQP